MRLAFLGTSEFARPALTALVGHHEIVCVVTQPDRPAGRRQELRPPAVKTEAARLGLPIVQPERINMPEGLRFLKQARPEAIVVAAYGQILREAVFDLPPFGTINIHASLLPRYRGAAPINWAIMRGEAETGITTFLIDAGMDTGPILIREALAIGPNETAGELHDRLADLGARVIIDTLAAIDAGTIDPVVQDETLATLAPRLHRDDGRIDWRRSAKQIHNHVRGLNPWPGAFSYLGAGRVKIHRTSRTGIARGTLSPGEIALPETGRLLVAADDALIEILELQREGRPRTDGRAFLNGLRGGATFS